MDETPTPAGAPAPWACWRCGNTAFGPGHLIRCPACPPADPPVTVHQAQREPGFRLAAPAFDVTKLTPGQLFGVDCVICGSSEEPMRPVGMHNGVQLFACLECAPAEAPVSAEQAPALSLLNERRIAFIKTMTDEEKRSALNYLIGWTPDGIDSAIDFVRKFRTPPPFVPQRDDAPAVQAQDGPCCDRRDNHYHCAGCGEVTGMYGHSVMGRIICDPGERRAYRVELALRTTGGTS